MKIKSLLIGSVAAVGLSTGAYAADLGTVLTSLNVCDALGLAGLNISSASNCLTITGGVEYSFKYGDYDSTGLSVSTNAGSVSYADDDGSLDWASKITAWLQFEGSADSSFGRAAAVIKLKLDEATSTSSSMVVDEAYVRVGDSTVLMAGLKGSIFNADDDEPLNYLGLFQSEAVDTGVSDDMGIADGGHVIQIVSDLGNGVSVGAGLEDLNDDGSFVGVISYDADGITAHASVIAGDVLAGGASDWAYHAGLTLTQDMYTFVAAVAGDSGGYYNALASASVGFDMFTLAISGDTSGGTGYDTQVGVGGSISAAVSDSITLNVGARWFDDDTSVAGTETTEVAAQLVAAVTETITLTGEVGAVTQVTPADSVIYFGGELAWAPGGGFTSSIGAEANSDGAYSVEFKAAKDFE